MNRIYLDNSATTPLHPRVDRAMKEFREKNFANAGSVHRGGQLARVELDRSRDVIATHLGVEPAEVIFTSGGTEANNLALKGYAFHGWRTTRTWPTIITTRSEHHAVIHPVEYLEELGAFVHYVDIDASGRVDLEHLRSLLEDVPSDGPSPLVSLMHVNNETGVINPIREIAEIVHESGGVLHVDAVQSFGKIRFSLADLGADLLSISSHKIHGPKGIGALIAHRDIEFDPIIHGGSQERDRRGGTEPVELAVGFAEAVRTLQDEFDDRTATVQGLNQVLREKLQAIERIRFVSPRENVLPNIVSVTFEDAAKLDGEGLIVGMDIRDVAVSNGAACTSGSMQPSHVLIAMGYPPETAGAAVRFSLSPFTDESELQTAADALRDVVTEMRRHR